MLPFTNAFLNFYYLIKKKITKSLHMLLEKPNKDDKYLV